MFNETIKRGEYKMKEGLHPEYQEATITCACGNVMKTNSTKKDMKVDICSNCLSGQEISKEKQPVVEQTNSRKNMVLLKQKKFHFNSNEFEMVFLCQKSVLSTFFLI